MEEFFGAAKSVRLHPRERAAVRAFLTDFAEDHPVRVGQSVRHSDPMSVLTAARGLSLSSREKDDGFDRIFRHMRRHPVAGMRVSLFERWTGFFQFHRLVASALCLMLLCGMGGSLAYAAEDSLPDDFLYPMKVRVTEPLRELVALTPESRMDLRLQRIEKRLQEANSIVEMDRMNDNVAARMTAGIENSIDAFEAHVATLREEGQSVPDDVILKYESILARHGKALETQTGSVRVRNAARVILQEVEQARVHSFGERMRDDQSDKAAALKHFKEHVVAPPLDRLDQAEDRIDEALEDDSLQPATRERLNGVRTHIREVRGVIGRKQQNDDEKGFLRSIMPVFFRSGSAGFLSPRDTHVPRKIDKNVTGPDVVTENVRVRSSESVRSSKASERSLESQSSKQGSDESRSSQQERSSKSQSSQQQRSSESSVSHMSNASISSVIPDLPLPIPVRIPGI